MRSQRILERERIVKLQRNSRCEESRFAGRMKAIRQRNLSGSFSCLTLKSFDWRPLLHGAVCREFRRATITEMSQQAVSGKSSKITCADTTKKDGQDLVVSIFFCFILSNDSFIRISSIVVAMFQERLSHEQSKSIR